MAGGPGFFWVNSIYIPLLEEPLLRARFGGAYLDYARHVPRLIPRARPWSPPAIPPQQALMRVIMGRGGDR